MKEWHYVDLDEVILNAKREEREYFAEIRKRERENRKWEKEASLDLLKLSIPIRMIGVLMLLCTVIALIFFRSMGEKDATFTLVTVPVGIIFLIAPGWNKPHR